MSEMEILIKTLQKIFMNDTIISYQIILQVLSVTLLLSFYEYNVYKKLSHRAFYSKAFHTGITMIPFFISTIILCLQSNLIITLGTIGALAIIRFRTAVKDPIDMIYILWAIHIGICCGCQLYGLAIITSLVVTVLLALLDFANLPKTPFTLVVNCDKDFADDIIKSIEPLTQKLKVKSRNYTKNGLNMVMELYSDDIGNLCDNLSNNANIKHFSVVEYDYEDII